MPTLIYIADPMCSWCYGFGPELNALLEGLPGLPVEVVVGGLRAFNTAVMDEPMRNELMVHWAQVHATSGLTMLDNAVNQPTFIYDTEPACRAVVTARTLSPQGALPVFSAIQHAFYAEGRDVTRGDILAEVACAALAGCGVQHSADHFLALWSSAPMRQATLDDFNLTKSWKIDGFPMLVLERNGQLDMVTSGFARTSALVDQLQLLVDNSTQS